MKLVKIMKRGIIIICLLWVIIINLYSASAIRINEIESNPAGDDSGNEWVELYSEEEIDLQDWKLINGDGDVFNLNTSFKNFYVVEFPSQWLDNKDEKVILKDSEDKIIDKTDLFADSSNNDKTWQFCGNREWIFEVSTENDENNCPEEREENEETEEEQNEDNEAIENEQDAEEQNEQENNKKVEEKQEKTTEETKISTIAQTSETEQASEIIKLGNRKSLEEVNANINGKILYESSAALIKKYGIYAFSLVLIVIIIILSFKIRKIKKQNV